MTISNNMIYSLIKELLDDTNFTFTEIKEGLSNKIYKIYHNKSKVYILRKFGRYTPENRDDEITIINLLSEYNISRKIVKKFDGGLLETYVDGETLDKYNLYNMDIIGKICKKMRIMHNIKVNIGTDIFQKIRNFKKELVKKKYNNDNLYDYIECINEEEYLYLEKGLCHNDLLLENIIYNNDTKVLSFIDLEYAGQNYIYFDIANFFCEMCGMDCDMSLFPKKHYRYKFYSSYDPTIKNYEEFDNNVIKFVKYSHLLWGLWGLNCSLTGIDEVNFDYSNYSKLRLKEIQICV